jgi:proteasome lid subunit RPN8/RPN11
VQDKTVTWTIRQGVIAEMTAHARDERPRECCGLLVGLPGRVLAARRAANLSPDPNRFLIDPKAHIEARREGRVHGTEVVGYYHSHPHSAPVPSPTDLSEAWFPDLLYAIVGLAGDDAETRIYELRHAEFVELAVTVVA